MPCKYFIFAVMLISLLQPLATQDVEETSTADPEQDSEDEAEPIAEGEPDAEKEAEVEEEPDAEKEAEVEEEPDAEKEAEVEEEPDAEKEPEAEKESDAEVENGAEEDPDAEEEPDAEPEKEVEVEEEPEKKVEAEEEPEADEVKEVEAEEEPETDGDKEGEGKEETDKDSEKEEEGEIITKIKDNLTDCEVSEVLVSMADALKELKDEVQSMKKQMIKSCPGFENGNETKSDIDDEKSNATLVEENDSSTTKSSLPPIPLYCDPPFRPVASSCYYFLYYPVDWKSWGDANSYCQKLGGTLAAPYRIDDLRQYLIATFSNVFWVGAKKLTGNDTYEWMNGNVVEDDVWKEGQPTKSAAKFCVYLEFFSGYKAVNHYCGEKFSFVCEKREEL